MNAVEKHLSDRQESDEPKRTVGGRPVSRDHKDEGMYNYVGDGRGLNKFLDWMIVGPTRYTPVNQFIIGPIDGP